MLPLPCQGSLGATATADFTQSQLPRMVTNGIINLKSDGAPGRHGKRKRDAAVDRWLPSYLLIREQVSRLLIFSPHQKGRLES